MNSVQFSDVIATLALIISIGSLWLQDRGVRKQLLVSNISEYTKRYQEIFEKLPKSVIDPNFNLKSLHEDEQEKILRVMWLYFDLCYEEYLLYHELKLINEKVWKHWESAMISAFARPSFYQCWEEIFEISSYSKSFAKFIDDKMDSLHKLGRQF